MKRLGIIAIALLVVAGAFWFFNRSINAEIKARLDEVIARAGDELSISYNKLERAKNNSIVIKGVSLLPKGEEATIEIKEVVFKDVDTGHDIPRFMNVALNGFELSPETLEMDVDMFKFLGLEETITINVVVDYRLDEKTQTLNINAIEVAANNLGKLSFTGSVDHLNVDALELMLDEQKVEELSDTESTQALTDMMAIEFKNASLSYTDNSLITKVLSAAAKTVNMSKDEMIDGIALGFEEIYPEFGLSAPMPDMRAFLKKPKRLELKAAPNEPVKIADLMMGLMMEAGIADIPSLLNLVIVAEAK